MDSRPSFTVEQLRMLVEQEREMDAGRVPYAYVEGCTQRASMRPKIMEMLGLETGQKVSSVIFMEILKLNIQECEQEIAYRDLLKEQGLLAADTGPQEGS